MKKRILGLDLGTNSIGWSVIENDWNTFTGNILGMGSRIIPMDAGAINKFAEGTAESKAKARSTTRSARRLKHRYILRRTRLIQVFKTMGWFPENYPENFKSVEDSFNINDYIPFSDTIIDEAKYAFGHQSIPTDWIVYYLRKKALTTKIELSELARIIYLLNQRRGYKSQRSENEEEIEEGKFPKKRTWVEILSIKKVEDTGEKSRNLKIFKINANNAEGVIYSATINRSLKPLWEEKNKEIEITETTTKNGEISYVFNEAKRSNWKKNKEAIEKDINSKEKFVGEYFFEALQKNSLYKVREQVIDRKFYEDEFDAIWDKQEEFYQNEMNDSKKIRIIAFEFYKHNIAKQNELLSNNLKYLIKKDILFYQRPLKSQKHTISVCRYEKKTAENGKEFGVKVAPCSAPLFQEFRIWQTIHNLKVFNDDTNTEITSIYLNTENKEKLYELFDNQKEVTTKTILTKLGLKGDIYRLNYPAEKTLPGNETKALIYQVFKRNHFEEAGKLIVNDPEKLYLLWHILYSLPEEENVIKALKNNKNNFNLSDEVINKLARLKQIKGPYAAYSSLALKKLLPVMRCGKYYVEDANYKSTKERIDNLLTGEDNKKIDIHARENIQKYRLQSIHDFQGLPTFLACYVVYGRHSERDETKFREPAEMQKQIIEHGSLRNPVVEQVINETLRLVQEAWKKYGQFDEIHIELARDLKNNNAEKVKITENNLKNAKELKRIKELLKELNGANPDSSTDMDRLRLWEETASMQNKAEYKNLFKKESEPTKSEIERYKLWGEQNCISPYTGRIIPLSKLFNKTEYEIDHIIPRSRFFDDSLSNKTICETAINKFKDKRTALQLIIENGGQMIKCGNANVPLLSREEYENNIKRTFFGRKKLILLTNDIPDTFVNRQLNDTRYISKKIGELLQPAVKSELVFTSGNITSDLKEKWGLHRTWKRVLEPRFKRLESITNEVLVEFDNEKNDIHFKKDYKRIDHRHHALDALVVACTSREHIRYLNTLNAQSQDHKEQDKYKYLVGEKVRSYKQPWAGFEQSAKNEIEKILVSHKNRTRILTKGFNRFEKFVENENGNWEKKKLIQSKDKDLQSVRVSMFKEPLGLIKLKEYEDITIFEALKNPSTIADRRIRKIINKLLDINEHDANATLGYLKKNPLKDQDDKEIKKVRVFIYQNYAAKRVTLDKSFTEDKIDKIPYAEHSPLAKALRNHLTTSLNDKGKPDPNVAFTGEGLELLHKKLGYSLKKITTCEPIGTKRNFQNKLMETDKGSNLFFVINENLVTGKRKGDTLHLIDAIERLSKGLLVTETPEGYKTIVLSPGDFVYVPRPGETIENINWEDTAHLSDRLFKMVSSTKKECFFILHTISAPIEDKKEFGTLNKIQTLNDLSIQSICLKVKVDILGNITPLI